ncbi:MAG: hypothetical protein AVDCRST_MAG26-638, partial [uncultured Chloroflexia bacterium]
CSTSSHRSAAPSWRRCTSSRRPFSSGGTG